MSSIFKVSPPQEGIKRRLLLALSLGAFLLISSIALILTDPMWAIAKYKFRLANGSILHELLSSEMEGGRFAVYLFNITNPDRFLSGEDPYLKLDEVGPFTYLEYRTHSELQFDREAGVMRYTPRMRSVFVPEESIGNPEDIFLTMPNIPMLSATTMIRSSPVFIRNIYNIVARQYGSQPIVKLAASKYLWGYKDPVLTFANSLVPGLVYFNTTGIMDRLYDKNVHYRMELGTNDDDKFKIKRIHKYTRLHPESEVFDESILTFNDTYEGMAYPPMIGKNTPINIFRLGICKSFEMEYHGNKTSEYGPNAFVYKFNEKMFENNLCDVKGACPKGVMDLSACFYGLPMGLSKGHLLDADPKLFDRIKGLKPDPEKHSSHLVIEPKIGLTLETSWSLQANIFVGDITYNAEAKMFSNMILPIAHFKIKQPHLPSIAITALRMMYITVPKALFITEILLMLSCLLLLVYSAWLLHWKRVHKKQPLSEKELQISSRMANEPLMSYLTIN
ncbi:lysosome membrane protein 2-like [Bombyx mori]|uniref:Scavenger receptor class B member 1 n=1 Tax=Bombyx mori TaxID=7091 RepID=K7ZRZ1_BOMMO|nr:lysosome membrane protein 2-like [Bombyx mori]BAM67017.1 scavenger receptor class B type 1 like protein 15 [Bombyx mori]